MPSSSAIEYSVNIHAFSYSNWAGDLDSKKSTTGYVLFAAGAPIKRSSNLQPSIAASIMKAECMEVFNATQECV